MTLPLFERSRWEAPTKFAHLVTEGDERAWAVFSHDAQWRSALPYYRYLLCRVWDPQLPLMGWICANPSKATHLVLDPSVRKMIGFAKRRELGGILLGNLLAAATPYPKELLEIADPLGPDNLDLVRWLAEHPKLSCLVAGWGDAIPKKLRATAERTIANAHFARAISCFGKTAGGRPRHPLMLAYDTPLEVCDAFV